MKYINKTINEPDTSNLVVLAFSGGLDTSFCVPYLIDKGFIVHTIFVDSGGVSDEEKESIKARALTLGAVKHHQVSIAEALWEKVVTPLIKGGVWYQNQYPLLCSDRYLIVEACLALCEQLGTRLFAHGCTGMGNDQVRFDLAVHSLGDYEILSPIREIQAMTNQVRAYEESYLKERGYSVSNKVTQYSINENLLGVTISGSEIDQWQAPKQAAYVLTKSNSEVKAPPIEITFTFEQGTLTAIDEKSVNNIKLSSEPKPLTIMSNKASISAENAMQMLNKIGGSYAIGRGIYSGDTTIGLKGRIVFESPALTLLNTAHTALEQAVLSKAQNRFKSKIAQQWTELVYEGFFYEPLKADLEAFLNSSQQLVSGSVTLSLENGSALPVAITSEYILQDEDAVYAQSAGWSIEEAKGFIKLFGKSSILSIKNQKKAQGQKSEYLS